MNEKNEKRHTFLRPPKPPLPPTHLITRPHKYLPQPLLLPRRKHQYTREIIIIPAHLLLAEEAHHLSTPTSSSSILPIRRKGDTGRRLMRHEQVIQKRGDIVEHRFSIEEEFREKR